MTDKADGVVSYTMAGAAAATGWSIRFLDKEIQANRLVAHHKGRRKYILAEDLMDWLKNRGEA